ncbi:MAG: GNAT family N-acetyltransferase [Nocardioides sp.]
MTEPSGIEVRVLRPEEWRTWREIRLRSLADSPGAFGSTLAREQGYVEADWRRWLDGVSVLATVDGVPAALGGGFRVRDGWMQVVAMWTDPAYRRRGLAVRVLDIVVAAARAEGRRLVLDVAEGNSAARNVYERYGFQATGESEPIRPGSPDRADLMVLPER